MKLPLHIAQKLLELSEGRKLPSSQMRHEAVSRLLADGVLVRQIQGRSKTIYCVRDKDALFSHLSNHFGVSDLRVYVQSLKEKDKLTRAEAVAAASDSKLRRVRTFKGFPMNCYRPVEAILNGEPLTILPRPGIFTFIYDYHGFLPAPDVTIVGVENPENFRFIEVQEYLFSGITPLFVSLYPRSGDLLKWLQGIPNPYLHFGDFDFAGIAIFLNEYKRRLGPRARLFVPGNIDELVAVYGNRRLYNAQMHLAPEAMTLEDKEIVELVKILNHRKKGLEQEILIKNGFSSCFGPSPLVIK